MPSSASPIDPQTFWAALKSRGLTFFSGVPDSTFGGTYHAMIADPEIRYVQAVREDVALGVVSAAHFQGRLGGVMMQNSGIGNIVNPLTIFQSSLPHSQPCSWRMGALWGHPRRSGNTGSWATKRQSS